MDPLDDIPEELLDEPGLDEPVPGQAMMFGDNEEFMIAWQHWKGMPEFRQDDLTPVWSVTVNFADVADIPRFAELVGSKLVVSSSRGIWWPPLAIAHYADKRYRAVEESEWDL